LDSPKGEKKIMRKAKLRDRIEKLKALAAGNANPNEAARAAEKARELEALLSRKSERGIFEKLPDSGIWWIRYTDAAGRYRREKAGSYTLATKLLSKRRGDALAGRKLPETLRSRPIPFSELADDGIKYINARYSRPADDRARMELLKERLAGRAADSVKAGDVMNLLDTLTAEKKWSASTRNHHHNLLSLAYRLGILHGKVKDSPLVGLHRDAENNSRVRFLTPEEEAKLREAIRSNPGWAEHEVEIDLAMNTGLRRRNMYRDLVWENVDLQQRTATVQITKNGDPVTVPLNNDAMRAMSIFRGRGNGTGRVVRNADGEELNVNSYWFVPAVRKAGIRNLRWHDLRHHFASRLRQTGTPLGNIAELLGHKGLAMTKRYAHLSISNLHEAVSRISNSTPVAPEPIRETSAQSYVN
jgi:integrase